MGEGGWIESKVANRVSCISSKQANQSSKQIFPSSMVYNETKEIGGYVSREERGRGDKDIGRGEWSNIRRGIWLLFTHSDRHLSPNLPYSCCHFRRWRVSTSIISKLLRSLNSFSFDSPSVVGPDSPPSLAVDGGATAFSI